MSQILTGSWFAQIPPTHIKVGISRGRPRGLKVGYRVYRTLAPGPWFRSVTPDVYLKLYNELLATLDPQKVTAEILKAANGKTPVMCCFESVATITTGETWCHRHIAASWLEQRLGIEVPEIGAPPGFDPWVMLRRRGIDSPSYR